MAKSKGGHGPADYQIIVNGRLDNRWSDWFAGTTIEPRGAVTIIEGNALDRLHHGTWPRRVAVEPARSRNSKLNEANLEPKQSDLISPVTYKHRPDIRQSEYSIR